MWGYLATAGLQAGLSFFGAKKEAKRRNAALEARKAIYEDEKKYLKRSYEAQTFNKRIGAEMSGAYRIASSAAIGASRGAAGFRDFRNALLDRELSLDKLVYEQRVKRTDREISAADRQMRDPRKEGWDAVMGVAGDALGDYSSHYLRGKLEDKKIKR